MCAIPHRWTRRWRRPERSTSWSTTPGTAIEGAVEEVGDDDLREQFETNVFGVWRICRGVLPGMRERGSGTIVNVSSFGGQAPFPGIGAYRSSKFALEGLTWTLRLEVAHFGIRVLSVQPGLTASQFGGSLKRAQHFDAGGAYAPMRERAAVAYARMSPEALEPETVAEAIVGAHRRRAHAVAHPRRRRRPRMTAFVESSADAYERELVEGLGFDWHPLGCA